MRLPESRVLLVDGDYEACESLATDLWQAGFQVDFAYDADSAFDLAREQTYGLILLAHWPPYLDALGLMRRMRRLPGGSPCAVLLVNHLQDELAEAAANAGFEMILPRTSHDRALSVVRNLLVPHRDWAVA